MILFISFSLLYSYLWFFVFIFGFYINFQSTVSEFSYSSTILHNQHFQFNINSNINALSSNNLKHQKHDQYFMPKLCSQVKRWTHQSQDFLRNYSSNILLISFVPLSWCNGEEKPCQNILSRFEKIYQDLNENINIFIVAKLTESPSYIKHLTRKYPLLQFEQETQTSQIWNWFKAKNYDHFIFDRCSKLSSRILFNETIVNFKENYNQQDERIFNQTEILNFNFYKLYEVLKSSLLNANCGWCQYDTNNKINNYAKNLKQQQYKFVKQKPTSTLSTLNINSQIDDKKRLSYLNTQKMEQQQKMHEKLLQQQLQNEAVRQHKIQEATQYQHLKKQHQDINNKIYRQNNNFSENYLKKSLNSNANQNLNKKKQNNRQYSNEKNQLINSSQSQPLINYSQDLYNNRYQYRLHSSSNQQMQKERDKVKQQQQLIYEKQKRLHELELAKFQNILQQQEIKKKQLEEQQNKETAIKLAHKKSEEKKIYLNDPAPLYPEGSENVDYYNEIDEWVPENSKLIISSAPTLENNKLEDTINDDYMFQLPCDSFNDEICYQQHNQLKLNKIHRCCKDRILLTDQCNPTKCSNLTQQLCCIQKFLQAKLSCCSDVMQLKLSGPTNHFSQCCYKNFVTKDDKCCTMSYAFTQWQNIYELCQPNVKINLSHIKVPTALAGTSLTTEFDFSKTDKWNFECKYGSHVPQFNYFEN